MSHSNQINISSDNSFSDSIWDDDAWHYVLNNTGKTKREVFAEVSSRKRNNVSMSTTPSSAGPSTLQSLPKDAIIKEDSSESMSSYISPSESTDDDTFSRVLVIPPLGAVLLTEELQAPPARALLTAQPPEGPSSSSLPVRGKVFGLACPKVWRVIDRHGAPKVMPEWAFPKKP